MLFLLTKLPDFDVFFSVAERFLMTKKSLELARF
jgi:hypothetical protein